MSRARKDKKMEKNEFSVKNMLDIASKSFDSIEPHAEIRQIASVHAQLYKAYLDEGIPKDIAVEFISALIRGAYNQ